MQAVCKRTWACATFRIQTDNSRHYAGYAFGFLKDFPLLVVYRDPAILIFVKVSIALC